MTTLAVVPAVLGKPVAVGRHDSVVNNNNGHCIVKQQQFQHSILTVFSCNILQK